MIKNDILKELRKHEKELRQQGVAHVAIFGSYARDQQNSKSDIDILIELNPNYEIDIFSYVALKERIATFFDHPVDVIHKARPLKENYEEI